MTLSVLFDETRDVRRALELVDEAEALGFHGVWFGTALGFDPVAMLAVAATRTERIRLGTAVVPTWPRHPYALAQEAATAYALSDGRFRLGVGPSHVPLIESLYGIPFEKPLRHVNEYLTVLRGLLHEGDAQFDGATYRVHAPLDVTGGTGVPVMLSVLSEQMCRAAGRLADGAITWLAPPEYVASVVVPHVRHGAAEAGREPPPVIAEMPALLATDRDAVRAAVREQLAIYPFMPFYAAMLEKAGVPDAADAATGGWTDAMIDAVVPSGREEDLAATVAAFHAAGADEVVLSPFGAGPVPAAGRERTLAALGELARAENENVF